MAFTVYEQTLFGATKTDACYQWTIQAMESEEGYGLVTTTRGLVDGKKTSSTKTIKKGKNIGKVNETTAFEQAVLEAKSKVQSKLDEGYDYTIEGSRAKYEDQLKPMLAHVWDKQKSKIEYPCYGQPKLDGVRCLARKRNGKVTLYSRGGKEFDLLPHIQQTLENVLEEGQCTDGEIYVHGWDFQRIVSAVKKTREDTALLEYHIYDMPNQQDKEMIFYDRFLDNVSMFSFQPSIQIVETVGLNNEEELFQYEEKCVKENYEGIMVRNCISAYCFGHRSYDLQKVKRFEDAEFKIIDVYEGRAVEEGCAIFTCETEDGATFNVRPTGNHDERKEMWNNRQNLIGKWLTVKFQGRSTENVPRFPVGLHIREYWDMGE